MEQRIWLYFISNHRWNYVPGKKVTLFIWESLLNMTWVNWILVHFTFHTFRNLYGLGTLWFQTTKLGVVIDVKILDNLLKYNVLVLFNEIP